MKRSFIFTVLLLWVGVMLAQGSVKIILINGVGESINLSGESVIY